MKALCYLVKGFFMCKKTPTSCTRGEKLNFFLVNFVELKY